MKTLHTELLDGHQVVPKRVLVVDDDPDILTLMRTTLEGEGYVVEVASDGLAGLDRAWSNPPDVIILDVMLPGLDGANVTRKLKERQETLLIPIIMVTALADKRYVKSALWELGVDFYITKPFDPDDLIDKVKQVVIRKKFSD